MEIMTELSSGPELLIIAGPNGAGKTTFVNTFLPEYTNVREFVNADLIAKGISPFEPEGALIEAGKVLLGRVRQLIEEKFSFALETTLSGKSYIDLVHHAKDVGFTIRLYYIYLNSVELSINRIKDRVRKGGHNVERDVVIRRYERSLKNLFSLYLPLAEEWQLIDNSTATFRPIAESNIDGRIVLDKILYDNLWSLYGTSK
jgi:predicted ABC-type ATPase